MEKVEFCRKITELGRSGQRTLQYFVITGRCGREDRESVKSYGVGIRILESGEERNIEDITVNRSEIDRLADLLASNCVTPITLDDVVYDWLCT